MAEIICLKEYKKKHDIPLPRSPYFSLNATKQQLHEAYLRAAEYLRKPCDYRGIPPYAAVVGYESLKTGKIKLLKEQCFYSSKDLFMRTAGLRGYKCLALVQKEG